jgi:hypothetical protein
MWDVTPREQIVLQKIVLDPEDYSFPDTLGNKLTIHLYFLQNKLEVYNQSRTAHNSSENNSKHAQIPLILARTSCHRTPAHQPIAQEGQIYLQREL